MRVGLIIRALWDLADEIDQQVQSRFNACSAAHDDRTVSQQASALFKKRCVGSWVLMLVLILVSVFYCVPRRLLTCCND